MRWALQLKVLVGVDVDHRRCQRFHKKMSRAAENVVAISEDMEISQEGLGHSRAVLLGEERGGFVVGVDV